jgi:hypothetical protein
MWNEWEWVSANKKESMASGLLLRHYGETAMG